MGLSELRDRRSGGGSEEIADSGLAGERGQYAHAARIGRLGGRRRRCSGHAYERTAHEARNNLGRDTFFPSPRDSDAIRTLSESRARE